jgi:cytochrome c oxidase subunit II
MLANFWMPTDASTAGRGVDNLFAFILWVSVAFFGLIAALLVYFAFRYRHREGVRRSMAAGHSTALELIWTIIPLILVLIMFYYGFADYLGEAVEPPNALEIRVTGRKWSWQFTHPGPTMPVVQPELYVPYNKPVRMILESDDVIHSLYIPAFRLKKDVVPGRYNQFWFQATEIGTFQIFCAEYCGRDHSQMLSKVHVLPEPEWRAKMLELSRWDDKMSPIAAGEQLYRTRGCMGCHSIDGSRTTGPSFKDLYGSKVVLDTGATVPADDAYILESIFDPNAKVRQASPTYPRGIMPSFRGGLSQLDVFAMTAYFKSISANFRGDLEPLRRITPATQPVAVPAVP